MLEMCLPIDMLGKCDPPPIIGIHPIMMLFCHFFANWTSRFAKFVVTFKKHKKSHMDAYQLDLFVEIMYIFVTFATILFTLI